MGIPSCFCWAGTGSRKISTQMKKYPPMLFLCTINYSSALSRFLKGTQETKRFCVFSLHVCCSNYTFQSLVNLANPAWLWYSHPRSGYPGDGKSRRIDFSHGKVFTRGTKKAKSVLPYVQVPGELVRIFSIPVLSHSL